MVFFTRAPLAVPFRGVRWPGFPYSENVAQGARLGRGVGFLHPKKRGPPKAFAVVRSSGGRHVNAQRITRVRAIPPSQKGITMRRSFDRVLPISRKGNLREEGLLRRLIRSSTSVADSHTTDTRVARRLLGESARRHPDKPTIRSRPTDLPKENCTKWRFSQPI